MPLQKQNVPLSLNQGINTKIDPKQLPLGSFSNLENINFDKEAEFNKRFGYDEVSSQGIGGTALQSVTGIANFKDQPVWISKDQIYSYSSAANAWVSEGSYDSVVPKSKVIVQNGFEQQDLNCAFFNNYQVFAYISNSELKLSILDGDSDSYVLHDQTVPDVPSGTTTLSRVRMAAFNGQISLTYAELSGTTYSLQLKQFDLEGYIKTGLTLTSGTTLAPNGTNAFGAAQAVSDLESTTGDALHDLVGGDAFLAICYHDDSSNDLRVKTVNESWSLSGASDPFGASSIAPQYALDCVKLSDGKIAVTTVDSNDVVNFAVMTGGGVQNLAPVVIEDVTTVSGTAVTTARNVTCATLDNISFEVFYQCYQTAPWTYTIATGTGAAGATANGYTWNLPLIRKATHNRSTSTTTVDGTIARGVGLASKAFSQDINNYINVIRESKLHATYFTMKSDGTVQAKISQGVAGPLLGTPRVRANDSTAFYNYDGSGNPNAVYRIASLSPIPQITSEKYLFVGGIQGKIVGDVSNFYSLYGINSSILNFSNEITNQTASIGDNLHFAGGQLKAYDGNVLTEENFNYPPDNLIVTDGTGTGVFDEQKTYSYRAIYSWTDAQGNIHRSGFNEGGIWTSTGTSTLANLVVQIPTLPLTQKSNVYLELYRTAASGTVFYKTDSDSSATQDQTFNPILNYSGYDMIQFNDITPDSTGTAPLSANEIIYTTGGVLENISPPSCSIIGSFKNRLFLAGLEDKLELRYSKLLSENVGVEFNDSLSILTSQVGGDIVALKGMDDKLIIFKENAIFYLSGDGPNNLGQQDNFTEPQLVSSDVGCSVKNSVVLTPQGLFFKSSKGIYLLTRSIGLQYVGAPMEDFNHLTIVKAELVAKSNEVRFLTSDGPCLVYNYFRGFWTTYTNHRGEASVMIGDIYYYVHKSGGGNKLYKQNYNSYTDNNTPIPMIIETGWMNPVAAQSAIRVYRMLLLGDYFTPHRLKISVAYDYNDDYVESSLVDVTDYTEVYEYGDPGVSMSSTGTMTKGFYGDPGGTTGSYTTAIAFGGKNVMQYQIRVDFKKQKCEAMRLKIETVQQAGQNGRGVNLSQLLFVAGSRGTEYKIKQSRIFKTT